MSIVFSHDDLVALLRRTTDRDGWLDPLLASPDGAAAMGASVEVFARVSAAMDYDCNLGLISLAPGGSSGTTTVRMSRAAGTTSGSIPQGYSFVDARGVKAIAATRVPVAVGQLAVSVPVVTLRQTEMVNTYDAPVFSVDPASPVVLDSLLATPLIAPEGSAGIVATTFVAVSGADPIVGGASDWLALHGSERGVVRQSGESTEAYRARVRNIPDAVSPIAVADGVLSAASRSGLVARVLEPFDDGASASLRARHGLGAFGNVFLSGLLLASPGADFLDDTGDDHGELTDRRSAIAYFRVELDGSLFDTAREVFYLDDGYWDDPVLGYADVSFPPKVGAAGNAVWSEASTKKAGGVAFDVYLDAYKKIQARGSSTAPLGETVVWTMAPAAGHAWVLADMVVDHDASMNAVGTLVPGSAYHRVRFTYDDASTFTTAAYAGLDSERLTPDNMSALGAPRRPITRVEGIVISDTVVVINLVGTLFVLDLVWP